ncbi:hypothetical protein MRB53_004353 [Persea americana]|uniref:Uncharacterized protein n=1 Tax=Persea americana TaxID=3435 RepID=A0ACC2MAA9_PERAE|nr:hypothetical protein MRB53_004353 [Persea americana]
MTIYHCNLCDDFSDEKASSVQRHTKGSHKSAKYLCPFKNCPEGFEDKRDLENHKNERHTGTVASKLISVKIEGWKYRFSLDAIVASITTVFQMKEMIANKTGQDVEKIRLKHNGEIMVDHISLARYEIKEEAEVFMSARQHLRTWYTPSWLSWSDNETDCCITWITDGLGYLE